MNPVAIVGGGITGLCAAYRLRELGIPATLYEAASRVGGVIRSVEADGFLAESGPNTILETSPVIRRLVADLGLERERLYSAPEARNRYILRRGKVETVPETPLAFCRSRLFSWPAKLRLPLEVAIPRSAPDDEESVAAFVTRRLGREFLDYAVNPMVGGIYAGDPARLSLRHAFPRLHAAEQRYGSLILGQWLGARKRKRSGEVAKPAAPKFSFTHGLQSLVHALETRLGDAIILRSGVEAIRRVGPEWEVTRANAMETRRHSAVLLAAPAHKLAALELEDHPARFPLAPLREIPYAPVASLVLGFRREAVTYPLDGFGVLIPAAESRNLLGVIFSSSLFPNRAPGGHVTLTCYLGGVRSPALARQEPAAALRAAMADLRDFLGVREEPVFLRHTALQRAIPQYEIGFGRFRELMDRLEADLPGLFLAGHFRDGISMADSILAGDRAAHRIHALLSAGKGEPAPLSP